MSDLPHVLILQIGDIHYPETCRISDADIQDPTFPTGTGNAALPAPLLSAIRKIQEICEQRVDGIIICGDLTTQGHLPGYKDCLAYLCQTLQIGPSGKWTRDQVHVVPGNHDVVREFCDPDGNNWQAKFAPLAEAWTAVGFPVVVADALRRVDLQADGLCVVFYSANSCIGCGVTRSFAPEIRDALEGFIKQKEQAGEADTFHVKGELLDTPAFEVASIETVADEIKELAANVLPIVVAHHNLLPQATPRVALYSELMNAGLVRTHLENAGRFVLYCHGHIHDNPIEIVSNAEETKGRVLCVSAPRITEGFNTIRIESSLDGQPLGCVITRYHKTRGCDFQPLRCQRIGVHHGLWSDYCAPETRRLIELLDPKLKKPLLFRSLTAKARQKLGMDEDRLRLRLLEAEWLGVVELTNSRDLDTGVATRDVSRWYIRRV